MDEGKIEKRLQEVGIMDFEQLGEGERISLYDELWKMQTVKYTELCDGYILELQKYIPEEYLF